MFYAGLPQYTDCHNLSNISLSRLENNSYDVLGIDIEIDNPFSGYGYKVCVICSTGDDNRSRTGYWESAMEDTIRSYFRNLFCSDYYDDIQSAGEVEFSFDFTWKYRPV